MESENFFGLGRLTDLGTRSGIDVRPTLLRVLTDLYVHRLSHTEEEERHYTELALRMLDVVDIPTRVAVASRFARYLSPPPQVLQRLARDLPEVAAELRSHPLLRRQAPAAPQSPRTEAARIEPIDAATAKELNGIFFAGNAGERRLILLNFDVVAPAPALRAPLVGDPSVGARLERAILAGNGEEFAHQLANALKIPHWQAQHIARDELGEPVVVSAKALGMPRDVLYRVLIFVNPSVGHSVERVHALALLHDEITAQTARGMVAIWQALHHHEQASAKHRPLMWDDGSPRRARLGAAVQRLPAARRPSERQNAS